MTLKYKICTKCNILKPITDFGWKDFKKRLYRSDCKICFNIISTNYHRSKLGFISKIYAQQKRSSKKRNHSKPSYTKKEFINWMFSQSNFEKLYNDWVKSDYAKDLAPSVDRLDDYKPYSLDNIQLMTWKENREKAYEDQRRGINNKNAKTVHQYDINNNFIKSYVSVAIVAKENRVQQPCISRCCLNKQKTSGGYKWKYEKI